MKINLNRIIGHKPEPQMKKIATLGDIQIALAGMDFKKGDFNKTDLSQLRNEYNETTRGMTYDIKESMYNSEPMTSSAIDKTATKMFNNWFDMDTPSMDKTMNTSKKDDLNNLHNIINLKSRFMDNCRDSIIYGNSYILMIPEKGEPDRWEMPIIPRDGLLDIEPVDSKNIVENIIYHDNTRYNYSYVYRDRNGRQRLIHQTRMLHVPWKHTGAYKFGKGVYDVGWRSMLAKLGLDWTMFRYVYRYQHPFIILNTTGGSNKDIVNGFEILKKINPDTGFSGTEKHQVRIENPAQYDPENFIKFYYMNMACMLDMPLFEFIGAQRGQVEGGEKDLQNWYDALSAKQSNKYTPVINRINNQYLKGNWFEQVYWNPIFTDKRLDAEIQKIQTDTLRVFGFDLGVLDELEVRQAARDIGISWFPADDSNWKGSDEDSDFLDDANPVGMDIDKLEFNIEQQRYQTKNKH